MLLAGGVFLCWLLYPQSHALNRSIPGEPYNFADDAWAERILLALAAIVTLVPMTRRWILAALEKLRTQSPARRRWSALGIFIFSQPLLYILAIVRGRVLLPYWHDENFYRLQTTFLAHGKLGMPGLALPDFFDAPYVFVRPIYGAAYFPGTALLHVPAAWLHLPYWFTPLLIAGATLALLYLIATELIDGVAGWLAVLLMLSLALFRWMALIEMSHAAGAMWGLTVLWAWLSWRRSHALRWITLAGLAAGWYAITRPLDCALILTPIALAWAWDLRAIAWKMRGQAIAIAIAIIAPFIALQLTFDRAVTGHPFQSPMGLYYRTYFNLHGIGLEHYDPAFVPPTSSQLIRDTYDGVVAPRMRDFQTASAAAKMWFEDRLPLSFATALPTLLLLVPIPVGLLALRNRKTWVVFLSLAAYLAGSGFVFQFLDHYVMAIAALVIILLLMGAAEIARAFPNRHRAAVFLPLAIALLAMHRLCLNDQGAYQRLSRSVMHANDVEIPARVRQPAIVLFRYGPGERSGAFDEEPVYNWDVVNPDDAPIIRAHDLGPLTNRELFAYYAKRQPGRNVYLFDRAHWKLEALGNVKDLDR
jgi:hypothetical protein